MSVDQVMIDQLQSALPFFRVRLMETIAWCTREPLESNPLESAEIRDRRKLGEEAGQIVRSAYLSDPVNFAKSALYRRARKLWDRARLGEIVPLAHQLRSPFLQPDPFVYPQSDEERMSVVEKLAEKRAERLRFEKRYPPEPQTGFTGRLLLYAPDENLCDGAAQYSSKGFFDVNNIPPWDTWVCFFERYVVSWVPPKLLELANIGIDVNPEGCILWAPEAGLP